MSERSSPVSEACQMLAEIVTSLSENTRRELTRLLGHSVAMPTTQELREMRIGLLVEMVAAGELPKTRSYDRTRNLRERNGEDWPGSTGLIRHYGTWTAALRAAVDLAFDVTKNRARARTPQAWPPTPYSRREVLEALAIASEKVGQVIGQWEYVELRRVERQLAWRNGSPDPRYPEIGVVRKNFGGWDAAISKIACIQASASGSRAQE